MAWGEWVTWGFTAVIAAGGLVLGIRSEIRSGYRKTWVLTDGPRITVFNRTGEDATRVRIEFFGAEVVAGSLQHPHIAADDSVRIAFKYDGGPARDVGYRISWTRPSTGKRYRHRSRAAPKFKVEPEAKSAWG